MKNKKEYRAMQILYTIQNTNSYNSTGNKFVLLISLILLVPFFATTLTAQNCTCNEYVYVNEVNGIGRVHKYLANADGSLTEIFNNGDVWYPGGNASELPNPHGLGTDINGNIYVGEDLNPSNVRQLSCDGTIVPVNEFAIPTQGQFNIATVGNTLFINDTDYYTQQNILAYDLCTGNLTDQSVTFCENVNPFGDWGFTYNANSGLFYSVSNRNFSPGFDSFVWIFDINDFDNDPATCVSALPLTPTLVTGEKIQAIESDNNGNFYIVSEDLNGCSYILKYDATGTLVTTSARDCALDGTGYAMAIGLVYSETTGLLYLSSISNLEDCVTAFDTDLNLIGPIIGPSGGAEAAKGINISSECCPNTPIQTITQNVCIPAGGVQQVFLNDIYGCEGNVCEGLWEVENIDQSLNYQSCDQSVLRITGDGCATFSKVSDGMGDANQCGAFNITLNVCVSEEPVNPVIDIVDNDCATNTPGLISVVTPCSAGNTLEWSTDSGISWSTTVPTYDPENPVTVRARCVNDILNTCLSLGTADVTSSPVNCCPPVNCINQFGEYTITKRRP